MELQLLSKLVDEFTAKKTERLAADKVAKALKKEETDLEEVILTELISNEVGSVGGTTHRVTRQIKKKPVVDDWPKFYAYMIKNKATELLQRRLNVAAIEEHADNDDPVPGIDYFEVNKLSVSKL